MSLFNILEYPDPRLREKCLPVKSVDDRIRKIFDDMAETMYAAPGVGLAAAQVGVKERLIVVDVGDDEETGRQSHLYKLANPEVISKSGTIEYEEGCLSLPGMKEVVKRAEKVVVEGLDENGKKIQVEADGLLAVCFQHEIDHINGVLFIDHISRIKREMLLSRFAKRKKNP